MNRTDFKKLVKLRLKEAKVLLDNKCYEGAYYLAGYAVECALKACIAKNTKRFEFPPKPEFVRDLYKHDLTHLVKMAGLELELKAKMKSVVEFESNWGIVKDWSEQVRYETEINDNQVSDFYSAIVNEKHGVLSWLKKYW
jgi:HEPN domain-containing protein